MMGLRRMMMAGGGGAVSDTLALLHFDDGFSDAGGRAWSAYGNAQITGERAKFGGGALLLDGSGAYISTADVGLARFGTGDFTIELWADVQRKNTVLVDYYQTGAANCWQVYLSSGGAVEFYSTNGGTAVRILASAIITPAAGDYTHIAVCRASGVLRIFVNGGQGGQVADSRNYNPVLGALSIGAQINSRNYSYDANGRIDEVRIIKGVAKYTAAFTPPAAPFVGV